MEKLPALASSIYPFMLGRNSCYDDPCLWLNDSVSCLVRQEIAYEAIKGLRENFSVPDIRVGTTSKVGYLLIIVVERGENKKNI